MNEHKPSSVFSHIKEENLHLMQRTQQLYIFDGREFWVYRDTVERFVWRVMEDGIQWEASYGDRNTALQSARNKKTQQFKVQADAETGEWIGDPEYVGNVDLTAWNKKEDTDKISYDTYEFYGYEIEQYPDGQTRAIAVNWI